MKVTGNQIEAIRETANWWYGIRKDSKKRQAVIRTLGLFDVLAECRWGEIAKNAQACIVNYWIKEVKRG